MRNQSAQTLILILLVMAISLTVGLGVASRAVSTLRQSSSTAQSTAAYHAAEAGTEYFLKTLTDDPNYRQNPDCTLDSNWTTLPNSDASYCCTVRDLASGFSAHARQDDVVEVDLSGASMQGKTIDIRWHTTSDSDPAAAITFLLVEDRGDGTYNHVKSAYDPHDPRRIADNNFSAPSIVSGDYGYRASVDMEAGGGDRDRLLRIRPLYSGTHLEVSAQDGTPIPRQQVELYCEGEVAGIVRRVRVIKGNPALPAIFDFALFSASQTQPLTK
jgi:Tfp pilus assembly protein PilX